MGIRYDLLKITFNSAIEFFVFLKWVLDDGKSN